MQKTIHEEKSLPVETTHEGAEAQRITAVQQLKRSVLGCFLWESEFYEGGEDISARISSLVPQVDPDVVAAIAIEAREKMHLRHVPLLLCAEMAGHETHRPYVADTVERVIQRPDELTEILAIYARNRTGAKKLNRLSKQLQIGIARAFQKFSEYSLAKYDRKREIRLRDALFLSHAKPKDEHQADLWKRLIGGELEPPDTWEVAISAAKGAEAKKAEWERLLAKNKLGGLALLRNLRNMQQAGIPDGMIAAEIATANFSRVLPFRFFAAATHAPSLQPALEEAMFWALAELPKLPGRTVLCIDHSGSMDVTMSRKSDLTRFSAAMALSVMCREVCENVKIISFNDQAVVVKDGHGFELGSNILKSQDWGLTVIQSAIDLAQKTLSFDRMIVFTDEQSKTVIGPPGCNRGYLVNVASAKNGISYGDGWHHIDGFSENIISYIAEFEKL